MTNSVVALVLSLALALVACSSDEPAPFVEPFDQSLEAEFEKAGLAVVAVDDLVLDQVGTFRLLRFQAPSCDRPESACVAESLKTIPWVDVLTREEEMLNGTRSSTGLTGSVDSVSCVAEVFSDGDNLPSFFDDFRRSGPDIENSWFARFECDLPANT